MLQAIKYLLWSSSTALKKIPLQLFGNLSAKLTLKFESLRKINVGILTKLLCYGTLLCFSQLFIFHVIWINRENPKTQQNFFRIWWMNGPIDDLPFYDLFNSISVILGWWERDNERLCALTCSMRFLREKNYKHITFIPTPQLVVISICILDVHAYIYICNSTEKAKRIVLNPKKFTSNRNQTWDSKSSCDFEYWIKLIKT